MNSNKEHHAHMVILKENVTMNRTTDAFHASRIWQIWHFLIFSFSRGHVVTEQLTTQSWMWQ